MQLRRGTDRPLLPCHERWAGSILLDTRARPLKIYEAIKIAMRAADFTTPAKGEERVKP